jgi:hypothetical protein
MYFLVWGEGGVCLQMWFLDNGFNIVFLPFLETFTPFTPPKEVNKLIVYIPVYGTQVSGWLD